MYNRSTKLKKVKKDEHYKALLSAWSVPAQSSEEEAWEKLQKTIVARAEHRRKVVRMRLGLSWGAAAALLAFAYLFVFPGEALESVSTVAHEHERIVLPDGSLVWLNAGSRLEYDSDDWANHRTLSLEGEAYFEVQTGHRFRVETEFGQVAVLGTKFNVFAREDFEVDCIEGKVAVDRGGDEVLLTEGMHVEMDSIGLAPIDKIDSWEDWRSAHYYYSEEPLDRVFKEIEIQFGFHLNYPNVHNRIYSGPLYTSDLTESLEMICRPMGMKFEIKKDNQVNIEEASNQ